MILNTHTFVCVTRASTFRATEINRLILRNHYIRRTAIHYGAPQCTSNFIHHCRRSTAASPCDLVCQYMVSRQYEERRPRVLIGRFLKSESSDWLGGRLVYGTYFGKSSEGS